MTGAAESSPILDNGTAPEVYVDDLGTINVLDGNCEWVCVRRQNGQRVANLKIICPVASIPNIAAHIVAAFADQLSRRVTDKLRSIAGFAAFH